MTSQFPTHIQSQAPNRPTPFNKAYFASKSELLNWASKLLDLELISLEQMGTGAIFCQLLDACHPGTVRLNKVNWKANSEIDYISNFKIFQQGLVSNDINKPIDINRLTKGKQYDLNELLQWIYGYYLSIKDNLKEVYNAKRKRGGQNFVFDDKRNEIKKKYRKRINLGQININRNLSSNNSVNSDISYQKSNSSVINLKQNLRSNNWNNNYINNNYNNINEDNKYRNKSKQDTRNNRYYDFEEKILNNNNIYTQNKNANNINNINNNNYYNTINRRCPSNPNINSNSDIYNTNNNNNYTSNTRRNFKNIFEKTPSEYQTYLNNQLNNETENINLNYEEDDLNNELENENNLDITDFFGLNEEEIKNLINQEKKDGNKIRDLKNIIRKLRINILSIEKEMANYKRVISEEYKFKNFYLNKLKDIEYLYFNPVIKNSNENKNTILRQLLCSNQDSTIFLDENNYAFLRSSNNDNIINNKNVSLSKKNSRKKIEEINNDIIMKDKTKNNILNNKENEINLENSITMNNNKNNDNKSHKLNYSSKKNYDPDYMNNLFDSFNDNNKIDTHINNNINYNQKKNLIIPIKLIHNNDSKISQYSSMQNNNTTNNTFFSNNNTKYTDDNYNQNENIKYKIDNGKIDEVYNKKKYMAYSEKKQENVNNEGNNINNKTAFKKNNIYSEISSLLLNDSLHIPNI